MFCKKHFPFISNIHAIDVFMIYIIDLFVLNGVSGMPKDAFRIYNFVTSKYFFLHICDYRLICRIRPSSKNGWGLTFGGGYVFPLNENFAISPFINYGFGEADDQDHNIWTLGIGLKFQ